MYGDSAYRSATIGKMLEACGYVDRIHRKATRNHPLAARSAKDSQETLAAKADSGPVEKNNRQLRRIQTRTERRGLIEVALIRIATWRVDLLKNYIRQYLFLTGDP